MEGVSAVGEADSLDLVDLHHNVRLFIGGVQKGVVNLREYDVGRIVTEDSVVYSWRGDSSIQSIRTEGDIWNLSQVAFVGDGPPAAIVA